MLLVNYLLLIYNELYILLFGRDFNKLRTFRVWYKFHRNCESFPFGGNPELEQPHVLRRDLSLPRSVLAAVLGEAVVFRFGVVLVSWEELTVQFPAIHNLVEKDYYCDIFILVGKEHETFPASKTT